jgi:hypothetical protein
VIWSVELQRISAIRSSLPGLTGQSIRDPLFRHMSSPNRMPPPEALGAHLTFLSAEAFTQFTTSITKPGSGSAHRRDSWCNSGSQTKTRETREHRRRINPVPG